METIEGQMAGVQQRSCHIFTKIWNLLQSYENRMCL
jgi:hypothetical protein